MSADPLPTAPPGHGTLFTLLADLRSARQEVRRLRAVPMARDRLSAAHRSLLLAMECYSAALTARGLPTPWRLRDELRLERSIERQRADPGL